MNSFKLMFAATATAISFGSAAFAGDQYVDRTGFAASGYDVVSYFGLAQKPVGSKQPAAVPGNAAITAKHNGATFAFSSEANKARFVANPTQYAPQYDGHCAYGVAQGGKVPANPNLWRIVDDKLYLNITKNVESFWDQNISGNLRLSERNWRSLEPTAASRRVIPQFTSTAPLK